jgi:hypothetical protein
MRRFIMRGGWVANGRAFPNMPILVGLIIGSR